MGVFLKLKRIQHPKEAPKKNSKKDGVEEIVQHLYQHFLVLVCISYY